MGCCGKHHDGVVLNKPRHGRYLRLQMLWKIALHVSSDFLQLPDQYYPTRIGLTLLFRSKFALVVTISQQKVISCVLPKNEILQVLFTLETSQLLVKCVNSPTPAWGKLFVR